MAQQVIDVGTSASDGTGDPLRNAFTKINDNFTELYATVENEGLTYGNIGSNVSGVTFNVTRFIESYSAVPVLRGTGQVVGNVYYIRGNVLGGTTPVNDLYLTLTSLSNVIVGNIATVSAVGVPVAPVLRVNGLTGNVTLTVNNINGAASKAYVNAAISANVANVTGTVTDSLRANIIAANAVIANNSNRIITLENNAAAQASQINNLVSVKANISYVDTSIENALSGNAILANVAAVNANVVAANVAILLRANLSGASFSGNISANSISATNFIRTDTYFVAGSEINQAQGQQYANPAALFFGNSSQTISTRYYQLNLQNLDPLGTGDYTVTADDGNDASNYVAYGIGGSQINDPNFPSVKPHDGYVFAMGGNLLIQSQTNSVCIMAGNLETPQISFTTGNVLQFRSNVVIQFADGTIQSTAFGGNTNVSAINANIAAANVAISQLQSNAAAQALELDSLTANSATQGSILNTLVANAATQSLAITNINANVSAYQTFANANVSALSTAVSVINANIVAANLNITTLLSNASLQSQDIDNLQSNAQSQQGNIIALQSNSAAQAVQINLLNANLTAANTNITSLTTQGTQINLLNANLSAANVNISSLQSNAASQQLELDNLQNNVNFYLSNVAFSNANVAAANARIIVIDANLGSTSTNVSILQSNVATLNSTKVNLTAGNVQANYFIANANIKIASTLEVGNLTPINYPGLGGVFVGNVDSYYQVVVQNLNSGPNASSDFVVTADDGDDSNNYINIGINSSGFTGNFVVPAGDTGLPEFAHDGYITVIGGNAALRGDQNIFLAANRSVVAVAKDGDLTLFNTNLRFSDSTIQSTAIQDVPGLYANIGTAYNNIDSINANIGSFQLYSNANIGTAYNNIDSINANIGSFQIYSNANLATQSTNFTTLNANVGALSTNFSSLDANIGSYQIFANTNIVSIQSNLGAYQTFANANLSLLTQGLAAANLVIDTKASLAGAIFSGNVQADYLLTNNNVKIGGNLFVGPVSPPLVLTDPAAVFTSNTINGYILSLQNINNGTNAIGEIRVTANDGNQTNKFTAIGMNNSGFVGNFIVPAGDTGLQSFPYDGYLNVFGGNAGVRGDGNIFLVANTSVVGLLKDSNLILSTNVALQFSDGTLFANANIGAQFYTPNNAANYNATITNIQQAMDELAARLRALGG